MNSSNVAIFASLRNFLTAASANPAPYVSVEGAFSRARTLSFFRVVLFIIGLLKRSLSMELYHFFAELGSVEELCTKSAFCQARKKLNSHFFDAWNRHLTQSFYSGMGREVKRWKGFRLCAVDGTSIPLPDHPSIDQLYGRRKHRLGSSPLAKLVCCYDVLNQLSIWSKLDSWRKAERQIAIEQLDENQPDMLMIYDRHYPGFESILAHHLAGQPFVMRIQRGFSIVEDFLKTGESQTICSYQIRYNQVNPLKKKGYEVDRHTAIPLRLVRIELPSEETEVLVTSLLDFEAFPFQDFSWLYQQRWKVETFFDRIKNKMCLEAFSGVSAHVIEQDIMAHLFVANLHSILYHELVPITEQQTKHRLLDYQPNYNLSLGVLIRLRIDLFVQQDIFDVLERLIKAATMEPQPVRPNRSVPRKRKRATHRKRHRTIPNYKRAV